MVGVLEATLLIAFNELVRHSKFQLTLKVVSQIQITYFTPERQRILCDPYMMSLLAWSLFL